MREYKGIPLFPLTSSRGHAEDGLSYVRVFLIVFPSLAGETNSTATGLHERIFMIDVITSCIH